MTQVRALGPSAEGPEAGRLTPGDSGYLSALVLTITIALSSDKCLEIVLVTQSCLPLCDPMDCSRSGSSVHGISQARTLEWVAIPVSKGSS